MFIPNPKRVKVGQKCTKFYKCPYYGKCLEVAIGWDNFDCTNCFMIKNAKANDIVTFKARSGSTGREGHSSERAKRAIVELFQIALAEMDNSMETDESENKGNDRHCL